MPTEFLELNDLVRLISEEKITNITQFHAKVVENGVYVAVRGTTYDGAEFIDDALNRGASYIIGEFDDITGYLGTIYNRPLASIANYSCSMPINTTNNCNAQEIIINDKKIWYYKVDNARKALSYLCSKIYALPISVPADDREQQLREEENERARSAETRSGAYIDVREHRSVTAATTPISVSSRVIAVTGTNGKTSVANFYAQLAYLAGFESISIGTMGGIHFSHDTPKLDLNLPSLTTPSAEDLYRALHTCAKHGIKFISIEASSHGLDQHRLEYLELAAVGFTNLSHDHLDYHHTMDNYFAAKRRLFSNIHAKVAVLNADIPEYQSLKQASESAAKLVVDYGYNATNLQLVEFENGKYFILNFNGKSHKIPTQLVGLFQVYNLLCAFGMFVYGGGVDFVGGGSDHAITLDGALKYLANIVAVPGRLELIKNFKDASIYVDYAHTPDALELVLKELRKTMDQNAICRLITIFGCGGDRDKTKRPIMGKIATSLSDIVVITDDNPRSEDPTQIRHEIIAGIEDNSSAAISEIADRYQAIEFGIGLLQPGDILLIAGKGHEDYQIIGNDRLFFSDQDAVLKIIGQL